MSAPKVNKSKKTNVKKSTVKKSSAKKKVVSKDKKNTSTKAMQAEKINTAKQSGNTLVLDTDMTINGARDLHVKLIGLSKSKDTVVIDASRIEMIDTAIFQLLLAFVITMNNLKTDLIWKEPSEQFIERATILDLIDALSLNQASA